MWYNSNISIFFFLLLNTELTDRGWRASLTYDRLWFILKQTTLSIWSMRLQPMRYKYLASQGTMSESSRIWCSFRFTFMLTFSKALRIVLNVQKRIKIMWQSKHSNSQLHGRNILRRLKHFKCHNQMNEYSVFPWLLLKVLFLIPSWKNTKNEAEQNRGIYNLSTGCEGRMQNGCFPQ